IKQKSHYQPDAHLPAPANMNTNILTKDAHHSLTEEHQKQLTESDDQMYRALEKGIQKAMDAGEIPQSNAYLSSLLFMSMLIIGKNNEKSFDTLNDIVSQTIDFFWDGLANQKSK